MSADPPNPSPVGALADSRRAETVTGWLLVLPSFIGFALFYALPTVRAFGISFTDWNLLRPPQFVGLENYAAMLEDDKFWNGMKLAGYYALINIPLQTALGLGLAVAMDRLTKSLFVKSVLLLPYLLSNVLVAMVWLWLLDEPLSNLDAVLRVQTRFEIAKLHHDYGRASMVYVTHDQVEAMTLADRILLLNAGDAVQRDGSVAQCGSPLALYHRPRTLFVAGFIGSPKMNFLPGRLLRAGADRALVELLTGEMLDAAVDARRLAAGAAVTLGLRPEHTELGSALQHLVRPVLWQERLGESTSLYLDSGTAGEPWIVKAPGNAHAAPGHRIAFGLPPTALHLFDDQGLALERRVSDTDVALPIAA